MEKTLDYEQYYEFLNALRKSGVTNMFGAAPYLEEAFELNRETSRKILLSWMESFRN